MSKKLLLMRHAKSSHDDATLADFDRPLNDRGRRDAPRIGQYLKQKGMLPDVIISSTANRAKTTAELVAEHCGYEKEIQFHDALYHGGPDDYMHKLKPLPVGVELCLAVGHNPGLERLVEQMTEIHEPLPTASIAVITVKIADWDLVDSTNGSFNLDDVWRPKELF